MNHFLLRSFQCTNVKLFIPLLWLQVLLSAVQVSCADEPWGEPVSVAVSVELGDHTMAAGITDMILTPDNLAAFFSQASDEVLFTSDNAETPNNFRITQLLAMSDFTEFGGSLGNDLNYKFYGSLVTYEYTHKSNQNNEKQIIDKLGAKIGINGESGGITFFTPKQICVKFRDGSIECDKYHGSPKRLLRGHQGAQSDNIST